MSDRVRFDVGDDHVGVVTLARPDKRNAMDLALFDGLHDAALAARSAIAERRCRAVLVIGEGEVFSAGIDVSLFTEQLGDQPPSDSWIAHLQQAFTGLEDLDAPVVAAVHGVAYGAGFQLALAAHLRVATPSARFGLLEARWGLIPDLGGLTRLPRLIGLGRATDLAVSARVIDAATAAAWGLVDEVLADDDFAGAARAYAARLASGPTLAIGAVPRLLRQSFTAPREEMLAEERGYQQTCLRSNDFREAAVAAAEGRPPRFTGR